MRRFLYLAFLFFISSQLSAQTNQRVGVNTTTPEATLHVKTDHSASDTAGGTDPFMVELYDSTKLKTFTNGGTSIGSGIVPPKNGLYVKGALRPDSGIATPQKLVVESIGNSITMKAGNSEVTIDASGNITIVTHDPTSNISIQSAGDLKLSGKNISMKADQNVTIDAAGLMKLNATQMDVKGDATMKLSASQMDIKGNATMKLTASQMNIAGDALMKLNGGIISLNGGTTPVAGQGRTVVVDPIFGVGIISTGSATVLVP